MMDLTTATSSIEKLDSNNYGSWSVLIQLYLEGQGIWSLIEGTETMEPTDAKEKEKWKMRAGKAKFVMASTVENELLQRITKASISKEAWDTLSAIFTKINEAKLQQLENELISAKQGDMSVSQCFSKVKSICDEIAKLDPTNAILEGRMRRLIIHGLNSKYNSLVVATGGWAKEPTLSQLESLIANQEALDKQMSEVSIKDEENVLYVKKGSIQQGKYIPRYGEKEKPKRYQQGWNNVGRGRGRGPQRGGARQGAQRDGKEEKKYCQKNGECYIYGKKGHFARDSWHKREEGNATTSRQNDSEEEWDLQVL